MTGKLVLSLVFVAVIVAIAESASCFIKKKGLKGNVIRTFETDSTKVCKKTCLKDEDCQASTFYKKGKECTLHSVVDGKQIFEDKKYKLFAKDCDADGNPLVVPDIVPVDGVLTEWVDWGECSKECGTGEQTRTRSCTNPPPSDGGNDCTGDLEETRECNTDECVQVMPVYLLRKRGNWYTIESKYEASQLCSAHGSVGLATEAELTKAWEMGLGTCSCGWLADTDIAKFPSQETRRGCGEKGINDCPSSPKAWKKIGWDAYCLTKRLPVYLLRKQGKWYNIKTKEEAHSLCVAHGSPGLASEADLQAAWDMGMDVCSCGWLSDQDVAKHPVQTTRRGCGERGLRICPENPKTWRQSGWDAYCKAKVA